MSLMAGPNTEDTSTVRKVPEAAPWISVAIRQGKSTRHLQIMITYFATQFFDMVYPDSIFKPVKPVSGPKSKIACMYQMQEVRKVASIYQMQHVSAMQHQVRPSEFCLMRGHQWHLYQPLTLSMALHLSLPLLS